MTDSPFDAKAHALADIAARQQDQRDWPLYWAGQFGHEATVWMRMTQGSQPLQLAYERARLAAHFGQIALESRADV